MRPRNARRGARAGARVGAGLLRRDRPSRPDEVPFDVKVGSGVTPEATILTFLIADIRGYTRFTAEQGDEAAARFAVKFASIAREAIEGHGGTLVELRGDEALAVFDSARQAIRTAVELQKRFVDATIADPTMPFAVGIGLDAGEAVRVDGGSVSTSTSPVPERPHRRAEPTRACGSTGIVDNACPVDEAESRSASIERMIEISFRRYTGRSHGRVRTALTTRRFGGPAGAVQRAGS